MKQLDPHKAPALLEAIDRWNGPDGDGGSYDATPFRNGAGSMSVFPARMQADECRSDNSVLAANDSIQG